MQVIRYQTEAGVYVGLLRPDGSLSRIAAPSLSHLLRMSLSDFRVAVEAASQSEALEWSILPPVDGFTEVWAAGVTYLRSRAARVEESAASSVYDLVYDADRPELFFKSVAWRVVGNAEPIGIRADSELNVPEPELALVINAAGELLGLTACNDVSSRSIEGENPLYLPQAKIYAGACSLGPTITPIWCVPDLYDIEISVKVTRGLETVWVDSTSTSTVHRRFDDLIEHLLRADRFPDGAILSTGTGMVPSLEFTLLPGDEVTIAIVGVGQLVNTVTVGREAFDWLPVPSSPLQPDGSLGVGSHTRSGPTPVASRR